MNPLRYRLLMSGASIATMAIEACRWVPSPPLDAEDASVTVHGEQSQGRRDKTNTQDPQQ